MAHMAYFITQPQHLPHTAQPLHNGHHQALLISLAKTLTMLTLPLLHGNEPDAPDYKRHVFESTFVILFDLVHFISCWKDETKASRPSML